MAIIGLLVTVFFAATLSSKAGELNALGATTTVDFYRHVRRDAYDAHYVAASRWFTVFWGLMGDCVRPVRESRGESHPGGEHPCSIFYGVVLGIFLVAFFFLRWVRGTAVVLGGGGGPGCWCSSSTSRSAFPTSGTTSSAARRAWDSALILQAVPGAGRRPEAAQAA